MPRDLGEALRERVARRAVHLLPQPETAAKLRKVIGSPGHSARAVVDALNGDPTVSAALVRVANSPAYARGGPVTSLATAVVRVGEKELARLALATSLGASTSGPGPLLSVRRRLAQDGMAAALVCERLAEAAGLDAETAFLAGLLHDVGSLVALATVELLLAQAPDEAARTEDAWLALAQVHHVELGMLLAEQWALPPVLRQIIEHHHDPDGPAEPLLDLVRAADALLALMRFGVAASEARVPWLDSIAPAARQALLDGLGEVPALVAAFDADRPVASTPSRAVMPAPRPEARPVSKGFEFTMSGGRSGTAEVCSPRQLVLRLKTAVPENHFAEVKLSLPDGPLGLWVRVSSCSGYAIDGWFEACAFLFAPSPEITRRLAALAAPTPPPPAATFAVAPERRS